jgi:molybdopterin-containing oxidoreductase family iron-sulfur binding subunit
MATESYQLRMTRDLQRALKKPERERAWVMVIDTRKCTACKSCMVACIAENHLPAAFSIVASLKPSSAVIRK